MGKGGSRGGRPPLEKFLLTPPLKAKRDPPPQALQPDPPPCKILNFQGKIRLKGAKNVNIKPKKQKIFAGWRRHLLFVWHYTSKEGARPKKWPTF